MIISHQLHSNFALTRELPNALPTARRSKAWRSHFIGRYDNLKNLRETTFYIFVVDEKYGFCKYGVAHGRGLSVRRRGKTYLRFQCDYPKERVVIVAVHSSCTPADGRNMLDVMHENFVQRMTEVERVVWKAPAVLHRATLELSALCDDSFEEVTQ